MADHFLTKSRIDLSRCIRLDDGPALEHHDDLQKFLTGRIGPATARLFAEPLISRGNDQAASTVSWYCDHPGTGLPAARLDDTARAEFDARLSAQLAPVADLLGDPEAGPLIAAALHLTGSGDIWSVGGEPILINWGLLPEGGDMSAAARHAQYDATLGRFLPLAAAPPLTEAERAKTADTSGTGAAAPVTATAAAGAAVAGSSAAAASRPSGETSDDAGTRDAHPAGADGGPPPPADGPGARPDDGHGRVPVFAWLPLVILLLLVGGVLVWLLMPGTRIFARDATQRPVPDAAAIAAAQEVNRALEQRLADLRAAHDGAVCREDGTLILPGGKTIEGLVPPDRGKAMDEAGRILPADKAPVLPPAPERVAMGEGARISDTASLLDHIDSRTAMVLAAGDSLSTGTGFFVGPDLLVTNFHVIDEAPPGRIFVTSKTMDGLKSAEVLKRHGPMPEVGADFALLRVAGGDQPFYTIRRSDRSLRLQSVIAAGYPGDVLRLDSEFESLRSGNFDAVPELTVTDGTVNTEQTLSERTRAVVHSAPISTGNSGGPLIDMCGRVVGVNTFVMRGSMRNLNFALAAPDLLAFLEGTPARPTISGDECQPRVARPTPPPRAAGQDE